MCAASRERVRIAVIGAGAMANTVHCPSLASFPDVDLVAACDIDEQRLVATWDRYGIAGRYSDYRRVRTPRLKPGACVSRIGTR